MLANIIIVVMAIIGISDGYLTNKPTKDSKPGIDVPKPTSYNEKAGDERGGWDRN